MDSFGFVSMQTPLVVHCFDADEGLVRPCVDCGLSTSNFCVSHWQGSICLASDRVPSEPWANGQLTPLCSHCETKYGACRFCRGVQSCTPPSRGCISLARPLRSGPSMLRRVACRRYLRSKTALSRHFLLCTLFVMRTGKFC